VLPFGVNLILPSTLVFIFNDYFLFVKLSLQQEDDKEEGINIVIF